jgi:transcriptional/translational regulatory protein YebC/TACO1
VALLVDVLTDNRNRSGGDVRNIFSKLGGSLAEPGAVGWQFSRKGVMPSTAAVAEDDLMMAALDAGAEDVQNLVTLDDKSAAKKVLDLVDALDDLDDVQAVHGNFDITDEVLAELG